MTRVFGVDIPLIIAGAFAGQLEPGTLHVVSATYDVHRQAVRAFADEPLEGFVDTWDERTRVARGWPAETVAIVVLARGITRPKQGDEVTIRDRRYRVLLVLDGGAEATWELAGVAVG